MRLYCLVVVVVVVVEVLCGGKVGLERSHPWMGEPRLAHHPPSQGGTRVAAMCYVSTLNARGRGKSNRVESGQSSIIIIDHFRQA